MGNITGRASLDYRAASTLKGIADLSASTTQIILDRIAASLKRDTENRVSISRRVTLTLQEGDQIRVMRQRLNGITLESAQHAGGIVFIGPKKLLDES